MFLQHQMCIIKRDFRQFNKMKLIHSASWEQVKFMNYIPAEQWDSEGNHSNVLANYKLIICELQKRKNIRGTCPQAKQKKRESPHNLFQDLPDFLPSVHFWETSPISLSKEGHSIGLVLRVN